MPRRSKEGDVLVQMTATLNQSISDQVEPVKFGEVMSSANFISEQAVKNAISKGGESDYGKVSSMMSAVKDHITSQSTAEKVTQKFSKFVLILYNDLKLDGLAQQLVEKLCEVKPGYKSPLDEAEEEATSSADNVKVSCDVQQTKQVHFESTIAAATHIQPQAQAQQQPETPELLHVHPIFPGVILSELPRQVTITPKGKQINLEKEVGVSISIPENAVVEDCQLSITVCFAGACELPDDVESVSPCYIVETDKKVQFSKDVELKLKHNAHLWASEAYEHMLVLKASGPGRKFEEVKGTSVKFSPGFAVIKVRTFSWFSVVWNKIKQMIWQEVQNIEAERYYSARLYKAVIENKVSAVFSICGDIPPYPKYCDEVCKQVITKKYPQKSVESTVIGSLLITSDTVGIRSESTTWDVTSDRSMISKLEVDRPERYRSSKISEFSDYPPRIFMFLSPHDQACRKAELTLTVTGLKKECSFSILNECFEACTSPSSATPQGQILPAAGCTLVKDDHYGSLCEQLRPCAANWDDVAKGLGFKGHEIANIRAEPMRLASAPGSFMDGTIERWLHWGPGDARGSKDYATLEALTTAVNRAGFFDIAVKLTLQ